MFEYKVFVLFVVLMSHRSSAELIDDISDDDHFCYPAAHKNTRKSCECSSVNATPWGIRALHIDCSYKDYKNSDITENLPLHSDNLDLSWNMLAEVPHFVSDSLRLLNLMHNNISSVKARNFINITDLHELYLSWNSIQQVEANAFEALSNLLVLDLSHNNLHTLPEQIFTPLTFVETLSLSWNRQLNQTATANIYESYGINKKLRNLKLDACNLSSLQLPSGITLKELHLRRNSFLSIPTTMPVTLEKLDFSDNPLEVLGPDHHLTHIVELYLEDMPELYRVAANALASLTSLRFLSFQNCRHLISFDEHAFGATISPSIKLETLIFRGTTLHTFNETLSPIFTNLTELDLNGVPLYCDCDLVWMKRLELQTQGRCYRPVGLRGTLLSAANSDDFKCDSWPNWFYAFLIVTLIGLFAWGTYLLIAVVRSINGVKMRPKVGSGSPYARVTIEPNRQDY